MLEETESETESCTMMYLSYADLFYDFYQLVAGFLSAVSLRSHLNLIIDSLSRGARLNKHWFVLFLEENIQADDDVTMLVAL